MIILVLNRLRHPQMEKEMTFFSILLSGPK
jgi:hypothetical protein